MRLIVNRNKCPRNHKCRAVAICPVGAIAQKDRTCLPVVDADRCILCEKCIHICPKRAFEKS
jgi:ferredoxin